MALLFVATNEKDLLLAALESLREAPPKRPLEILVVDNASTDGVRTALSGRPGVTVVGRDRRAGLGSNVNQGLARVRSNYLVICNCDILFRPGAVDAMADFLDKHPGAGIAAPLLFSEEGEPRPSARRWYTPTALMLLKGPWRNRASRVPIVKRSVYAEWDQTEPLMADWVPCPATMVRREPLAEMGGMDVRFPIYFNDVDVSLRMHEAGWEVWCVPEAEVVHLEQRASLRPFSPAWRSHFGSLVSFWIKHRGLRPRKFVEETTS